MNSNAYKHFWSDAGWGCIWADQVSSIDLWMLTFVFIILQFLLPSFSFGFVNAYLSFSLLGKFEIFSENITDICCRRCKVIYLHWSNTFTIKGVLRTSAEEDSRSYTARCKSNTVYSLFTTPWNIWHHTPGEPPSLMVIHPAE